MIGVVFLKIKPNTSYLTFSPQDTALGRSKKKGGKKRKRNMGVGGMALQVKALGIKVDNLSSILRFY